MTGLELTGYDIQNPVRLFVNQSNLCFLCETL